jgi:hypothetical protein
MVINYLHMFWSVDSTQLALTFYIQTYVRATPADNTPTSYTDGVLLTDIKAAHPRVLANTRNPQANYSCAWNVTTGACIHVDPGNSWQPALSYMWDATGALVPQGQPLTTTAPAPPAPALGPIGSPVGGSSFTIWQPGQIAFVTDPSSSNPSAPVPGLYRFFSDFPVWSPNGSHLHLDMSVNDVIVADGHSLPGAASPLMRQIGQNVPVLPMRDKGLAAALAAQANPQFIIENGSGAAVSLAWRPDGRMLAVDVPSTVVPGKVAPSPSGVALYDCATGKLLTTLYQPSSPYGKNDQTFMRWAGDGAHLILLDASTGFFTIWGPDQLPKA